MSAEQSGKAGELTRINMYRVRYASWRAYRANEVRYAKAYNRAVIAWDRDGANRAHRQLRLSYVYSSQENLSSAWCPLQPRIFPR
jgi:hypothetical protein